MGHRRLFQGGPAWRGKPHRPPHPLDILLYRYKGVIVRPDSDTNAFSALRYAICNPTHRSAFCTNACIRQMRPGQAIFRRITRQRPDCWIGSFSSECCFPFQTNMKAPRQPALLLCLEVGSTMAENLCTKVLTLD